MHDRLNAIACICLGVICCVSVVGAVVASAQGHEVPAVVTAVASGAVGALSGFLQHAPLTPDK